MHMPNLESEVRIRQETVLETNNYTLAVHLSSLYEKEGFPWDDCSTWKIFSMDKDKVQVRLKNASRKLIPWKLGEN